MKNGFSLLELILGLSLVSGLLLLVAPLVGRGAAWQGASQERIIRLRKQTIPLLQLRRDLAAFTLIRPYPFRGGSRFLEFPAADPAAKTPVRLIRYECRPQGLTREVRPLTGSLFGNKKKTSRRHDAFAGCSFEFSYTGEAEQVIYEPFLLDEPYNGPPLGIRLIYRDAGNETTNRMKEHLFVMPAGKLPILIREAGSHGL